MANRDPDPARPAARSGLGRAAASKDRWGPISCIRPAFAGVAGTPRDGEGRQGHPDGPRGPVWQSVRAVGLIPWSDLLRPA